MKRRLISRVYGVIVTLTPLNFNIVMLFAQFVEVLATDSLQ